MVGVVSLDYVLVSLTVVILCLIRPSYCISSFALRSPGVPLLPLWLLPTTPGLADVGVPSDQWVQVHYRVDVLIISCAILTFIPIMDTTVRKLLFSSSL